MEVWADERDRTVIVMIFRAAITLLEDTPFTAALYFTHRPYRYVRVSLLLVIAI